MARFHLPISNPNETLTRIFGIYKLQHYWRSRAGGHFDMHLQGRAINYSELQTVNSSIADQLRSSGEIIESNAFAAIEQLAQIIPLQFEDVRWLFTGRQS